MSREFINSASSSGIEKVSERSFRRNSPIVGGSGNHSFRRGYGEEIFEDWCVSKGMHDFCWRCGEPTAAMYRVHSSTVQPLQVQIVSV